MIMQDPYSLRVDYPNGAWTERSYSTLHELDVAHRQLIKPSRNLPDETTISAFGPEGLIWRFSKS